LLAPAASGRAVSGGTQRGKRHAQPFPAKGEWGMVSLVLPDATLDLAVVLRIGKSLHTFWEALWEGAAPWRV
jgi:hypothetical protein